MNKLWPLPLLPIPCQSIQAQEVKHAPTVEQCRADQRLWMSKLEQPNRAGTANVSFDHLLAWVVEMGDCLDVDPNPKFASE